MKKLFRHTALRLLLLPFLIMSWTAGDCRPADARPNIVVILADDLGYMDIGVNNPSTFYETPHVDRLARSGLRFTNGYSACPVCSPTRFSILTGRYPTRVGATNYFSGMREGRFRPARLNDRMPLGEITLAEALRTEGYRTAFVGKWHLGPNAEYWPESQGFDVNIAGHAAGAPNGTYFAPYRNPRLKDGPAGEYLCSRLADEATRILDQFKSEPFLLYFAPYAVHVPLQAPAELVRKYEAKAHRLGLRGVREFSQEEQIWPNAEPRRVRVVQNHATYAAMVESMDTAVGRVVTRLKELGLDRNTIVCFTSDNGGLSTAEGAPTSNLPFRGGKGWLYEGGIRVPLLVKWPGITRPQSRCDQPVMSMDLYPTLLEAAGVKLPAGRPMDGVSLVPLLKGRESINREPLFWHFPHYANQGGFPGGAMRSGEWKLIERYEDGRSHLYNLETDVSEKQDLAVSRPSRVSDMRKQLHAWYRQVGARFLEPRPGGPQPWRP